jgi:EPS-associated MarR family transcriptional regulator
MMLTDELRYRLLKRLTEDPTLSQRDLAQDLGLSLGKVNFCIQALIEKGLIKAERFKNHRHKWAYRYLLTPSGLREKAQVTVRFLRRKQGEYDALVQELEELRREAAAQAEERS